MGGFRWLLAIKLKPPQGMSIGIIFIRAFTHEYFYMKLFKEREKVVHHNVSI